MIDYLYDNHVIVLVHVHIMYWLLTFEIFFRQLTQTVCCNYVTFGAILSLDKLNTFPTYNENNRSNQLFFLTQNTLKYANLMRVCITNLRKLLVLLLWSWMWGWLLNWFFNCCFRVTARVLWCLYSLHLVVGLYDVKEYFYGQLLTTRCIFSNKGLDRVCGSLVRMPFSIANSRHIYNHSYFYYK